MGKTIKIYLPDESVSGIRHAEITNWSGQALACPRSRFQELREWSEVRRPGVYFLFGVAEESGENAVYIGEAEVVIDRLSSHLVGKDFWTEVVAFTSKDENLTKAHVRYLEAQLLEMAKRANRYNLLNCSSPQIPSLPRSDRDAMEEFLGAVRMLMGALGHKVLDTLVSHPNKSSSQAPPICGISETDVESGPVIRSFPVFHLRIAGLHARGIRTDEGMVVLENSEAAAESYKSMTGGMAALRQDLIKSGVLTPSGKKFRLSQDYLFRSPSQAAGVLVGYSINGRVSWQLDDGTTYAQYENQQSERLLEEFVRE